VRPSRVVISAPRLDRVLRIGQAHEPARVETFITQAAGEAFGERILNWLPGLDEQQRDAVPIGPLIKRLAAELWAVVTDNRFRVPAGSAQSVEHPDHPLAWHSHHRGLPCHLQGRACDRSSLGARDDWLPERVG
jgi:hypothetical protein